ncbi:MAG: prepilin peptidase [Isosphaeraceae bacterium]
MTILQHWILVVSLFAAGACLGSFLNVCIGRLPVGLSLLRPPSRCPSCRSRILPSDNLPIVGWLRLGGRCRACRARIPARYPIVEAAVGTLPVAAYLALMVLGYPDPIELDPLWLVAWLLGWTLAGSFAIGAGFMLADGKGVPPAWPWAGAFAVASAAILPMSLCASAATLAMAVAILGRNPAWGGRACCVASTHPRSGFTPPIAGD